MPKPSSHLEWTVGNPDFATVTQEPSGAKKETGWLPSEKPPREFMNWLFWKQDEWNKYFEAVTDTLFSASDFFVGSGPGMYATLQLAHDAASPGDRILVTESYVVNTPTITISKNNIEVIFKPGVTYSKGSATTGISFTGDRCIMRGARWSDFSGVTDKAIEVASGAELTMLRDCKFDNNTKNIEDNGTGTTVDGCIDEDSTPSNKTHNYSIINGSGPYTSISAVAFDKTKVSLAVFHYVIRRRTNSENRYECGTLFMMYDEDDDVWTVHKDYQGTDSMVQFNVTAAGVLEYESDTIAGSSYAGSLKLSLMKIILRTE